jgi:hypothetical protein
MNFQAHFTNKIQSQIYRETKLLIESHATRLQVVESMKFFIQLLNIVFNLQLRIPRLKTYSVECNNKQTRQDITL